MDSTILKLTYCKKEMHFWEKRSFNFSVVGLRLFDARTGGTQDDEA
jgi:hypothetical protein